MPLTRPLLTAAVLGIAVVAVPGASAAGARTATYAYQVGGVDGVASGGVRTPSSPSRSAIEVPTGSRHQARLALSDASGRLAAVRVAEDLDGDGSPDDELGTVCGQGTVTFARRGTLVLYPVVASCAAGPAVTTTGSVTVTLR